MYLHNSL